MVRRFAVEPWAGIRKTEQLTATFRDDPDSTYAQGQFRSNETRLVNSKPFDNLRESIPRANSQSPF